MDLVISSFGYGKSGVPLDADLVINTTSLWNPYSDPKLKPLTGLDKAVSDSVIKTFKAQKMMDAARKHVEGEINRGVESMHVAFGCIGGRHRSVALAVEFANQIITDKHINYMEINHLEEDNWE